MGIRTRIGLVIAATAALVAAVLGLVVHSRMAAAQLETARTALDARLVAEVERYQEGQDTELTTQGVPGPLREAVRGHVRATYLDGPVLWAAAQVGDQLVALRLDYGPQNAELVRLDRILAVSGVVVAAVASLLGLLAADGLSRRIRRMAVIAERVAGGELSARVAPAGLSGRGSAGDEVATLGAALDRMADVLQARLEAERRVTADIAHELRTPVTGLVTAAELLPPGRPAEMVRDRAALLRRLVEDVLEVARLDAAVETSAMERRPVSVLARRAVSAAQATLRQAHAVEVVVLADAEVEADPRRVERILANLIANAVHHGTPPVSATVDATGITVTDHGPGFPDEMLSALRAHGPRRFSTGEAARGTGVGLGLTIAAGQARLIGATLTFGNAPDGGAQVRLSFEGAGGRSSPQGAARPRAQ
ncbi:ATP-binding protein [Nonomuraea spiralis]|uniref:histidine kinase n=1 Tax=Nonomuraea spiralis TaxID=46182 RepID=A0ABV5IUH7_9ACTN|nr:HAMP domain-containing sensor histidine kinase [Nonomuraea spiralis]GGT16763.1 sensor protein CseC [Nonomuraea spiralis]